jgi:hypothetical protein
MMDAEVDMELNTRAAAWAYDLVMKMDDATADSFITHVTYGMLHADLEGNRRTVDGLISRIHKRLSDADPRAAQIVKAFGEDDYTRDARGRFSTVEARVRTDRTKRAMPKAKEREQGIQSAAFVARRSGTFRKTDKLSSKERAAYQQQYAAIADAMDRMVTSGGRNPVAVVQDRSTGRQALATFEGGAPDSIKGWNPKRQDVVAVRYERPGSLAANASFDVVSTLAGPRAGQAAGRATQGVQRGGSAFAEQWNDASNDTTGTNARTYRRIEAGSQLLGQVSAPGSKTQAAAAFGELVGRYGPEAEKVVGPHMRKTAYRYRGTERKLDSDLLSRRMTQLNRDGNGENLPPEEKMLRASGAAVGYLFERLPNLRLSEIQRKSGRIPPSEGVIVGADGKVKVQAIGFADDHYLPFNLKNLGSLKGGEYVRTRSKGGLTTEDIYTGLVSGARRVTVVSNSGVFTINFSDDLRGARRYSDKAGQMVDRYAKTLDAIKNGQIEREPISREARAEIFSEVEEEMAGWSTQAERQTEFQRRIKDYKETPQLTRDELSAIDAKASEGAEMGTDRGRKEYNRIRADLIDQAMESKTSRFYQLDGEGYAASLEALREQYPYYIDSVSFMHRKEALNAAGERTDSPNSLMTRFSREADRGYVAPRYNRPEEVLEGYFDRNVAGAGTYTQHGEATGKSPAAFSNYSNWENNPLRGQSRRRSDMLGEPAEQTSTGGGGGGATAARPANTQQALAESSARVDRSSQARNATLDLVKLADDEVDFTPSEAAAVYPLMSSIQSGARKAEEIWENPTDREALIAELGQATGSFRTDAAKTKGNQLLERYRVNTGAYGGDKFDREKHLGFFSASPREFSESAYRPGAAAPIKEAERQRLASKLDNMQVPVEGADDNALGQAAAALGRASQHLYADQDTQFLDNLTIAREALGLPPAWVGNRYRAYQNTKGEDRLLKAQSESLAQIAEDIERLRALGTEMPQTEGMPSPQALQARGVGMSAAERKQQLQPTPTPQANRFPRKDLSDEHDRRSATEALNHAAAAIAGQKGPDNEITQGLRSISMAIRNGDFDRAEELANDTYLDSDVAGEYGTFARSAIESVFGSDAWRPGR